MWSTPATVLHELRCWTLVVCDVLFQKIFSSRLAVLPHIGRPVPGEVSVITGPTSGIGRETALELSRRGARVVLGCRDVSRGNALASEVEAEQRKAGHGTVGVDVIPLDLTDLKSVEAFAAQVLERHSSVHTLINNAGVMDFSGRRKRTSDGFELHMGVNHLAHFALTMRLMPALRRAGKDAPHGARVVNVSSLMHIFAKLTPSDMHGRAGAPYRLHRAYGNSKAAQILFTRTLRRHLAGTGVHAFALHPGEVLSNIARGVPPLLFRAQQMVMPLFLYTPAQGARASLYCSTSPDAATKLGPTHGYCSSNCAAVLPAESCRDDRMAAFLWQWSAREVNLPSELDLFDINVALPKGR